MSEEELYKLLNIPYKPWIELTDEEIMEINELKQSLKLYIEKWNNEKNRTNNRDEEIKLTAMIFLAQLIVNSKKGYGVDITKILDESNAYKIEKER